MRGPRRSLGPAERAYAALDSLTVVFLCFFANFLVTNLPVSVSR
jgi:hypothetical protein